METKNPSVKYLRRRKLLLVTSFINHPIYRDYYVPSRPVVVIASRCRKTSYTHSNGNVNTSLPNAHFKKEKEKDKLGLYDESNKDSVKYREAIKNDPYYKLNHPDDSSGENKTSALQSIMQHTAAANNQLALIAGKKLNPVVSASPTDPNEEKVNQKLAELKIALSKKQEAVTEKYAAYPSGSSNPDLERLQMMMK